MMVVFVGDSDDFDGGGDGGFLRFTDLYIGCTVSTHCTSFACSHYRSGFVYTWRHTRDQLVVWKQAYTCKMLGCSSTHSRMYDVC